MGKGKLFSRIGEIRPNMIVYHVAHERIIEMLVVGVEGDSLCFFPVNARRKVRKIGAVMYGVSAAIREGRLRRMP